MPTVALQIGPAQTLVQNAVYALPGRTVHMHSTVAVEVSPDGTTWDALTGADTIGVSVASTFVRCTTASPVVVLKV